MVSLYNAVATSCNQSFYKSQQGGNSQLQSSCDQLRSSPVASLSEKLQLDFKTLVSAMENLIIKSIEHDRSLPLRPCLTHWMPIEHVDRSVYHQPRPKHRQLKRWTPEIPQMNILKAPKVWRYADSMVGNLVLVKSAGPIALKNGSGGHRMEFSPVVCRFAAWSSFCTWRNP